MLRTVDPESNDIVFLDVTTALRQELDEWRSKDCDHNSSTIRRRTVANGAKRYEKQCDRCGRSQSQPIKSNLAPDNCEPWNDEASRTYDDERSGTYESILHRHLEIQKRRGREYETYLRSSSWEVKRQKVLSRADYVCEGCLDRPATQVHHLTYEHIKKEFLFELVAVCEQCHERIHCED